MEWTADELDAIGAAVELRIASRADDGTLSRYVIIWVVRVGDGLYVRSAQGPENGWFARARSRGTGRVSAGGVERDVRFDPADDAVQAALDVAYHAKYDPIEPEWVAPVVGPETYPVTLRLVPVG